MNDIRSVVIGCGSYLPEKTLSNFDLAKMVDTSNEWIIERTGIEQRHIAAEGEKTSDLAIEAAKDALRKAGIKANDIDLIILATSTPDNTFPSTAVTIQDAIGMNGGAAFDMQAVCSGFVFAINTADMFIKSGQYKRIMVVGAETFSRIIDWQDRTTCVLFGDGAGAVILEASQNANGRGIIASSIRSDGHYRDKLYVDGGVSSTQTIGFLRMQGREVFRHAVVNTTEIMEEVLAKAGMQPSDLDLIVPHQANKRIIEATARKFDLPIDRIVITVDKHGNTSAASIPLALCQAEIDGRLQKNKLVMLEAMGGGFTWGASLIRW